MAIYDISVPIHEGLVTWPGDPGIQLERTLDVEQGDPATVRMLHMGSHTGTHVDAFSHFKPGGKSLDEMDLSIYIGKARVFAIENSDRITPQILEALDWQGVERVLFKTDNSMRRWADEPFHEHFCHLTPEAARFLVDRGVKLVGIDYLSVEAFHSEALYGAPAPVHHVLMDAGIYIVEGLQLSAITPGWYELICLPLPIEGGDGAPARVVLKTLD